MCVFVISPLSSWFWQAALGMAPTVARHYVAALRGSGRGREAVLTAKVKAKDNAYRNRRGGKRHS